MKTNKKEYEESVQTLKTLFEKDKRVFIVQSHVSKSGMLRKIRLYHINTAEKWPVMNITHHVANVLQWNMDEYGQLKVSGCGMDMHFHTVYTLGCALYGYSSDTDKGGYTLTPITL